MAVLSSLQPLTFGGCLPRSLQGAALPSFGECCNQSLQGVMLPSSLQPLACWRMPRLKLQGVVLPRSLQPLAFGECFDRSLHAPSRGDNGRLGSKRADWC
jgi:hypothetical protein